jgi:hypothetical protein
MSNINVVEVSYDFSIKRKPDYLSKLAPGLRAFV